MLWIGLVWAFASIRDENGSAQEAELLCAHAWQPPIHDRIRRFFYEDLPFRRMFKSSPGKDDMSMAGPNPQHKYPIPGNKNVQFIRNIITMPNIAAGE